MYIGLIVKASKLCNLRCTYCYETPELANRQRMAPESVEQMFTHIREFLKGWEKTSEKHQLDFIWHGGEPFAQPISYWNAILQKQDKVFGASKNVAIVNNVQSNLTLLTEDHLPLLRHFRLGFSYDVLNDLRVDTAGQATANVVKRKIDWLRSRSIPIGGICVISKINIGQPETIADFFLKKNLSFRALNIYQARDMLPQINAVALPFEDYLEFFQKLHQLPGVRDAMDRGYAIDPLWTARSLFRKWKLGNRSPLSEQQCYEKEWAIMVNTNGDVSSPGDCYDPEFVYGNIFVQTFDEFLFNSKGRKNRIEKSKGRMEEVCGGCFLFRKGCDGAFVSHATPDEFREFQRMKGCYNKFLAENMKKETETNVFCDQPIEPGPQAPDEILYLNITYRCNSRCLFCAADVAYKKSPRQISLVDLQRMVGEKQYGQIQLSGGEPTIHPEILEIATFCRNHAQKVALLTHGRGFEKRDFAEKILQAGVNAIVIPLYGPDPTTHDHVSKVKGSFEQTVRGFKNLQDLRLDYHFTLELKFLLTKFTAPLNRLIYRYARENFPLAIDQVSICPLIYSQSTMDFKDEFSAPFDELKEELFSVMKEIRADGKYRLRVSEFPPCFFPEDIRSLAHAGLGRPVAQHLKFYGDDLSLDAISMDNHPDSFQTNVKGNLLVQSCRRCVHQEYCNENQTPHFSSAYLQQFGEAEFHPLAG